MCFCEGEEQVGMSNGCVWDLICKLGLDKGTKLITFLGAHGKKGGEGGGRLCWRER